MKKLLSLFLIMGILASLTMPCITSDAQTNQAVTFTVNSVQGEVGEVIPVAISMTEQSNIGVLTLELTVPTTYLSYATILDNKDNPVHWTSGEAAKDAGAMIVASNNLQIFSETDKGVRITSATDEGYWLAGNLITLYFEIIKPLPLEGISLSCRVTEILSCEFENNYTVSVVDGLVTSASATVIDMISKLPSFVTLADEPQADAAENAYNALTDVQKNAVTNLSKLQDAQAAIAALKAHADAVIRRINALNVTSLADEADVVAARTAYNNLADDQKEIVTNLDKLVAAENKIESLKKEAADKAAAQIVINQIDALNVTSLADEADVVAARTAYNNLTDAQKDYVTNLSKLTAAEAKISELKTEADNKTAAQVVINQIDALHVDSLDDEADVKAARTAYNNLTDVQKTFVTNLNKLTAAEAKIKDYQFAQGVIDMIDDLPADITLMDEDVVVAAREAYNSLTDTQKGYVTNLSKLVSAELKIADLKAAQAVIDQIYGLPVPLALTNEAEVIAARSAYNELNDTQKEYVSNLETLVNAENEIARLKELAEQEAADKEAAQVVINKIDALNVQSLDDEADVVAARNAYKGLTDTQKGYVTNLAKLQAAETKIAELKVAQEEQDAADLAAAKAVVDKIDALNVDSTDDEADVIAARAAFEALTDTQKGLVTNLSKLEDAEADIARLKADAAAKIEADKAAAKTVSNLIDALPATIVLTDESAVKMVRTAYNNLTDDQKAYVTNLDKLTAAEAKIEELKEQAEQLAADKAAAKEVDDLIDELIAQSVYYKTVVETVRDAYNVLTDTQKTYVTKLDKLEDYVAEQTAIERVIEKIDALDVQSLDDEPAVVDARRSYNLLTDAQKAKITNLDKLTAAEAKINDLKNVPPVVITYGDVDGDGNVSAADALEVLKSVVGKVTLTDQQIVAADVDGSGKVDAADALDILKKVVGKIQKFAVEE